MKIAAINIARVMLLHPLEEIDPKGQLTTTMLVSALVERYGFSGYPQKLEEVKTSIELTEGRWRDTTITKLTILGSGIMVDTRSSTDDSLAILNDMLAWGVQKLKLTYEPDPSHKRSYASQITFHSDVPLNALNSLLGDIAKRVGESVNRQLHTQLTFETVSVNVGYDVMSTKMDPPTFRLERRSGRPFDENCYFSQAPMTTQEHIALLEAYEAAVGPARANPRAKARAK
jgi:hypothetical protein